MRSAAAARDCSTLEIWASWVMGCVKFFTYWTKAWMSPTVMALRLVLEAGRYTATAKNAPVTATATYPRFPTNPSTGIMRPERNCAFQPALYSASLSAS